MSLLTSQWNGNDPAGLLTALSRGIQTGEAIRQQSAQQMQAAQKAAMEQQKMQMLMEEKNRDVAMKLVHEDRLFRAQELKDAYDQKREERLVKQEERLSREMEPHKRMFGAASETPSIPATDPASSLVSGDPSDFLGWVKGMEGWNPKAYGDSGQTSIGYGTRGKAGEIIDEAEGERRLMEELAGHASNVDTAAQERGVTLTPAQREALISFDFNTGRADRIFEVAANAGTLDPAAATAKMAEYRHADASKKDGVLDSRRAKEIARFNMQVAPSIPATDPASSLLSSADPMVELDELHARLGTPRKDVRESFVRVKEKQIAAKLKTKEEAEEAATLEQHLAREGATFDEETGLYRNKHGALIRPETTAGGKIKLTVVDPKAKTLDIVKVDGDVYRKTENQTLELMIPSKMKLGAKAEGEFREDIQAADSARKDYFAALEEPAGALEGITGGREKKLKAAFRTWKNESDRVQNWSRVKPGIKIPEDILAPASQPEEGESESAKTTAAPEGFATESDARAAGHKSGEIVMVMNPKTGKPSRFQLE